MKTNYEMGIVFNDVNKNSCLSEIVSNLEKLEVFADDIFNRINKNVKIKIKNKEIIQIKQIKQNKIKNKIKIIKKIKKL
jgi:hypothetical protein